MAGERFTDRYDAARDTYLVWDRERHTIAAEFSGAYAGAQEATRQHAARLTANTPPREHASGATPEALAVEYLTVKEFAAAHKGRLSEWLVGESVRRGQLPHIRLGGRILIPHNALDLVAAEQLAAVHGDH